MSPAVASLLIRRRRTALQIFDPLRCFSTQTLTLNTTDEGGARRTRRRSGIPMLLVFSQRNPQTCSLFGLGSQLGVPCLKFEREIHLPAIAAMDKTQCIGSSPDGFLLFTSKTRPTTDLFALNPLTGAYLPLPSAASNLRPLPSSVYYARALFSPSRDMVVLNRFHFADFACLCGDCNGARWTPLPGHFGLKQDLIFHKGLLYGVDSRRNLAVFDFDNPSSSTRHMNLHPRRPYGDDPRRCYNWLVESPDGKDLFLVFRYVRTPPGARRSFKFSGPLSFRVYKLMGNGIWKRVHSIGDMAIFVGISQSMSLSASDFPDTLIRNTIYFTESRAVTSWQSTVPCTGAFTLGGKRRPNTFVETVDANDVVSSAPRSPHVWLTPVCATVPQGPYAEDSTILKSKCSWFL